MHWYLVHTKPWQEKCALENLQRQGFQCYLPALPSEKLRQGMLVVKDEPLFPRYLFIRLGQGGQPLAGPPSARPRASAVWSVSATSRPESPMA